MVVKTLVFTGQYRDSIALMSLARDLAALTGVADASALMGTPANKSLLSQAGLLDSDAEAAGPADLIVAIRARDAAVAQDALQSAARLLSSPVRAPQRAHSNLTGSAPVRSLRAAVRLAPQANIAVISLPGQYAAGPAWDALRAGLHVLLFSDHVALEDEVALKQYARDHGLLVMGPGAGTALLNGIGLGFANVVPPGPVGIVAAAGTGLQEVCTLLAKHGLGITQGIGVGGRDVDEAVGGIMLLEGLKILQSDPNTRVILVVSKRPSQSVIGKILAQVNTSDKPAVLALMGAGESASSPDPDLRSSTEHYPHFAADLREAAAFAIALAKGESIAAARTRLAEEDRRIRIRAGLWRNRLTKKQRCLRALYSGGTLCEEALGIWQSMLLDVWSNDPLDPRLKLPDPFQSRQHTAVDLGAEEFTVGRPHPMIDQSLRVERLLREARDPSVAVIVLDVVLGYAAHPDPAGQLGPAIAAGKKYAASRKRQLVVIASITGAGQDPQGLTRQAATLRRAGAIVMNSNAAAARLAGEIVAVRHTRDHSR